MKPGQPTVPHGHYHYFTCMSTLRSVGFVDLSFLGGTLKLSCILGVINSSLKPTQEKEWGIPRFSNSGTQPHTEAPTKHDKELPTKEGDFRVLPSLPSPIVMKS